MITGDLDRALATPVTSMGTWRPAPPGAARAPGTYASSVAFGLARRRGTDPAGIAAALAGRLRGLDWVVTATVTGRGYLTVTVTAHALVTLAVRIPQAGAACVRTAALAGTSLTAPREAALASAATWPQAWRRLAAVLAGRLAEAAGAHVHWMTAGTERIAPADRAPTVSAGVQSPARLRRAGEAATHTPVAEAIGFAGADAITFALARLPPGSTARVDPGLAAAHLPSNPAYAVRYAHAHATSTLRQAADLGLDRGDAAQFQPRLLAHHGELSLLYELSWLPERAAGAARRGRPDAFARYLERLAEAYLGCQQCCPAVWPGMSPPGAAPSQPVAVTAARLWLVTAARTALEAGLGLLGVSAPARL